MSFDLCQVRQAEKPYYIENISTSIYSIEELCYYLYENVYLIDQTIMNEKLCDWIREELQLKRLYRTLYDQLEQASGIAAFVLPIFREIGYLSPKQMRSYQEALGRLEVQPEDARSKLKGDYLVMSGMFSGAVNEYLQILGRQRPGGGGSGFYSEIWNNLGCAFARMFRFERAADCFLKAWNLSRTKETLRRYVSVLPLYMSQEEYKAALARLGADEQLIRLMQEYNLGLGEHARQESERRKRFGDTPQQELEQWKEAYRRSAKCLLEGESMEPGKGEKRG